MGTVLSWEHHAFCCWKLTLEKSVASRVLSGLSLYSERWCRSRLGRGYGPAGILSRALANPTRALVAVRISLPSRVVRFLGREMYRRCLCVLHRPWSELPSQYLSNGGNLRKVWWFLQWHLILALHFPSWKSGLERRVNSDTGGSCISWIDVKVACPLQSAFAICHCVPGLQR